MIPSRANVCRILAVKATGASISSAISEIPSREPSMLLAEMYKAARMAYSQALENSMIRNFRLNTGSYLQKIKAECDSRNQIRYTCYLHSCKECHAAS
jgi:hypothetical protein